MINDMFHIPINTAVGDNLAGISDDYRIVRNVEVDVCPRSDHYVVSYVDSTDNHGVCADPYAVSNYRRTLFASPVGLPNHYSRRQVDVAPQPAVPIEDQVSIVANVEPRPNFAFDRNLKSVPVLVVIEQQAIGKSACNTKKSRPVTRRLAFAKKVAIAESGAFAKGFPERSSIIASVITPEVGPNHRIEIYRQSTSRGLISNEIVSRNDARFEVENAVAIEILGRSASEVLPAMGLRA